MNSNLKTCRITSGLKQTEIAERLGVTKQTINKWEAGRSLVPYSHWFDLCKVLDMPMDFLCGTLVNTLLDGCIESGSNRLLINAKRSRLYDDEQIEHALNSFSRKTGKAMQASIERSNNEHERKIFDLERALFERDKKIFELEQKIAKLERGE